MVTQIANHAIQRYVAWRHPTCIMFLNASQNPYTSNDAIKLVSLLISFLFVPKKNPSLDANNKPLYK